MAAVVSDVPVKLLISICFNIILYFLAGLRTEPSQFSMFLLVPFRDDSDDALYLSIAGGIDHDIITGNSVRGGCSPSNCDLYRFHLTTPV